MLGQCSNLKGHSADWMQEQSLQSFHLHWSLKRLQKMAVVMDRLMGHLYLFDHRLLVELYRLHFHLLVELCWLHFHLLMELYLSDLRLQMKLYWLHFHLLENSSPQRWMQGLHRH